MPDLAIRYLPLTDLAPYPKNARTHSPEQVQQIADSIREFGFVNPVLIDEHNTIIAGHGRAQAAQSLGMAQVPAITLEGLTAAQKRALRIADNKLALNASWSDEMLRAELIDLKIEGFDLGLTGFSGLELADLLTPRTDGLTDPDEVPEAPAEPVSRTGDVWLMGRHRLVCGDCEDQLRTDEQFDALVTDPPYGIGFKYDLHVDTPEGYGGWIWQVVERAESLCIPGSPIFVWQSPKNIRSFAEWFPRDWRLFCGARNFVQIGRIAMQWAFDAVLVWWVPGAKPWTKGTESRDFHLANTAGQVSNTSNIEKRHPCPRPADQVAFILQQWCRPGSKVLDPFSGSGTTIIAAETMGCCCHAIEISPQYVDVAIQRWQNFTGQQATLEYTGKTYEEMHQDRAMEKADSLDAL